VAVTRASSSQGWEAHENRPAATLALSGPGMEARQSIQLRLYRSNRFALPEKIYGLSRVVQPGLLMSPPPPADWTCIGPVDRKHDAIDTDFLDAALQGWIREEAASRSRRNIGIPHPENSHRAGPATALSMREKEKEKPGVEVIDPRRDAEDDLSRPIARTGC